jgi:hypothetical protein
MGFLRYVLIVSVAVVACGAAGAGRRDGKRAKPIREMVRQSDAVCIGRIKSVKASGGSVQKGDHWYRTKSAEVEVVEAFKKVKKGDKIRLVHSEIAGEMDVFDGAPRGMFLVPGSKSYLMFLKARGGYRALTEPDSANSLILLDRKSPAFKMLKRKRDETASRNSASTARRYRGRRRWSRRPRPHSWSMLARIRRLSRSRVLRGGRTRRPPQWWVPSGTGSVLS